VAAPERGSGRRLVPLSDIIVTTSSKTVDLDDPEVRRMLTELVTFEIDQAADFRRQGQTIDAVLQLTEAEKVSRALGMTESAKRIRAMMEEIRGE
jgi:predicted membrane chloride channel (bestrophin family)